MSMLKRFNWYLSISNVAYSGIKSWWIHCPLCNIMLFANITLWSITIKLNIQFIFDGTSVLTSSRLHQWQCHDSGVYPLSQVRFRCGVNEHFQYLIYFSVTFKRLAFSSLHTMRKITPLDGCIYVKPVLIPDHDSQKSSSLYSQVLSRIVASRCVRMAFATAGRHHIATYFNSITWSRSKIISFVIWMSFDIEQWGLVFLFFHWHS